MNVGSFEFSGLIEVTGTVIGAGFGIGRSITATTFDGDV